LPFPLSSSLSFSSPSAELASRRRIAISTDTSKGKLRYSQSGETIVSCHHCRKTHRFDNRDIFSFQQIGWDRQSRSSLLCTGALVSTYCRLDGTLATVFPQFYGQPKGAPGKPGHSQISTGHNVRRRPWSAEPPRPCWRSRSELPEASSPPGTLRTRSTCRSPFSSLCTLSDMLPKNNLLNHLGCSLAKLMSAVFLGWCTDIMLLGSASAGAKDGAQVSKYSRNGLKFGP
jgi:hypothetical protein